MSRRVNQDRKDSPARSIAAEKVAADSAENYATTREHTFQSMGLMPYPADAAPVFEDTGARIHVIVTHLDTLSKFKSNAENNAARSTDQQSLYDCVGKWIDRCSDTAGFRNERQRAICLSGLIAAQKRLGNAVSVEPPLPELSREQVNAYIYFAVRPELGVEAPEGLDILEAVAWFVAERSKYPPSDGTLPVIKTFPRQEVFDSDVPTTPGTVQPVKVPPTKVEQAILDKWRDVVERFDAHEQPVQMAQAIAGLGSEYQAGGWLGVLRKFRRRGPK